MKRIIRAGTPVAFERGKDSAIVVDHLDGGPFIHVTEQDVAKVMAQLSGQQLFAGCCLQIQDEVRAEGTLVRDSDVLQIGRVERQHVCQEKALPTDEPHIQRILSPCGRDGITVLQGPIAALLYRAGIAVITRASLRVRAHRRATGRVGVLRQGDGARIIRADHRNIGVRLRRRRHNRGGVFCDACLNGRRGLNIVLVKVIGRQCVGIVVKVPAHSDFVCHHVLVR